MNAPSLSFSARAPLALAAVAFASGIFLSAHLNRPAPLWAGAAALLAVCAIVSCFKCHVRLAQFSAVLSFVAAGAFARVYAPIPRLVTPPDEFLYRKVQITGHVIDDGSVLVRGGTREHLDLESESIEFEDDKKSVHRFNRPIGIRLTVSDDDPDLCHDQNSQNTIGASYPCPALTYGQRISFAGKLRLPRNFRNPGSFDYEGYLHARGLSALSVIDADKITWLPGSTGSRLGHWRSAVRRSILEHISSKKGLWNGEDSALLSAMVVGHDTLLLRDVREEFQQTGVYHLLVVSGMNVGLLAFAVFWVARRLRAPDWAASLITILLAAFYAEIAGMGVPIQRAVLMLSLFLVARLLYRGRAPLNGTGFAALVVLVLSPHGLFEAGFQLTFLALLAIFGISLPILERTSEPLRSALRHLDSASYDLTLSPRLAQLRLDLRVIGGRLARFLGSLPALWLVRGSLAACLALFDFVLVSTITQAVLVAPMRAYFHRAAIIGMPANVLVLPLAGLLLNSAVAAIALSYVSMPLARIPAFIASLCLHWTLACLHRLSALHISQWRIPDPGIAVWLTAATAIVLAIVAVRRKPFVTLAGIALLLVSAGFAAFASPAAPFNHNALEVTVIDVGQGDSILVVSPDGSTMLIDGGGSLGPVHSEFDFGEDVVSPYLWSRGLAHLDVIVLTHAHGDHIGGLPSIIQNFHPRELWLGINPETAALDKLLSVAAYNHVAVRKHTAGEAFAWQGTRIRVLSPPPDYRPRPQPSNDDSLALLVTYKNTSALLAGDLEKKMERFVALESPRADLLKVDHHGSATSTTQEFLDAVQPRFAAISVGWHNSYGHPREQVLERLEAEHVRTYRTDMLGLITFLLDGKTVTVKTGSSD